MARLNKKILCFVDEYGTAGEPGFSLGCVMVWANKCGRADKIFSDLLPSSINEVHAVKLDGQHLQSLLGKFSKKIGSEHLLMLNKCINTVTSKRPVKGERPIFYANALVETVKVGVDRFARSHGIAGKIGNVEVIIDANDQNVHRDFDQVITRAKMEKGRFKSVTRVIPLDSAASRLLQLADVVAHSRAWINKEELNAQGLKEKYKIEIL